MAESQKKRAPRGKAKTTHTPDASSTTITDQVTNPLSADVQEAQAAPSEQAPQQQGEPAKTVDKKPRQPRQPQFDHVGAAMSKYAEAGWSVHKYPSGSLNDFSACKDKNMHLVQVVLDSKAEDLRYHGEAKNTFIASAMPHAAVPVHAKVTLVEKEGSPLSAKISFVNVNTNARVIIAPARKKAAK